MTIRVGDWSGLDSGGAVEYLEHRTEKTWCVIGCGCRWGTGASDDKELRVSREAAHELSSHDSAGGTPPCSVIQRMRRRTRQAQANSTHASDLTWFLFEMHFFKPSCHNRGRLQADRLCSLLAADSMSQSGREITWSDGNGNAVRKEMSSRLGVRGAGSC